MLNNYVMNEQLPVVVIFNMYTCEFKKIKETC